LGAALREVYGYEDLLASIQLLLGSSLRHWAVGKIVDIRIDSAGGFDNGITTIEGESGRQYRILFQNENLVLYEPDGEALTTVPDIISLVSLSKDERGYYAPLSNSETHVNQDVLIVASKADPKWHEPDGRGYSCWKQVLIDAGYCDVRPQV
jgi:DUF917 family protein